MKDENIVTTRGSSLTPFLVGSVVGAGLALLFSPKPGREMRRQLKDAAVKTRDRTYSTFERSKEFYDETKAAISDAIEAGKSAFVKEREAHIAH